MKLTCSAIIEFDEERRAIVDQFVKRFASGWSEVGDRVCMQYEGNDPAVVAATIDTFERYAEHEIVLAS